MRLNRPLNGISPKYGLNRYSEKLYVGTYLGTEFMYTIHTAKNTVFERNMNTTVLHKYEF